MAVDPLKLAMAVGDQVRRKTAVYLKAKDLLAADVVTDAPFELVVDQSTISSVQLLVGEAVAGGSGFATITLKAFLIGVAQTLATVTTQAGVSKMISSQATLLIPTIPAGATLAVQISKTGGGVILPACMLVVSLSPNPPSE
jgi:hypothetical protein